MSSRVIQLFVVRASTVEGVSPDFIYVVYHYSRAKSACAEGGPRTAACRASVIELSVFVQPLGNFRSARKEAVLILI